MKHVRMMSHAILAASCLLTSHAAQSFKASDDGGFEFDTGVLRGRLRAEGKSLGLSSVVHTPTATPVDHGYGLFGHYRVFTFGKRYGGGAWYWPSTATLRDNGAVVLDLETTVRAIADLPKFECFLASYFSPGFTNSLAYTRQASGPNTGPGLLHADRSAGDWQMFPRDDAAVALIQDGRWKLEPNPVDWRIRPQLAQPLAVRRAPGAGLAVLLIAPAADCFAISTPFESEGHYSTYLSLFGRDIKAGETVRTRARLIVSPDAPDADLIRLGEDFLRPAAR